MNAKPQGLDLDQLQEGKRLSTEAKVDFFEEMTSLAFQAGARDVLEVLFFALYPPAAQAARAAEVAEHARRWHGFEKKAMAPERMHVNLLAAGQAVRLRVPYEVALARAAASVTFEPFDVVFDHAYGLLTGKDSCFVLGADAPSIERLRALQQMLVPALLAQGIRPLRSGPLQPHLTLVYGTHTAPGPEKIGPIAWRVDRFVLVRSLQGRDEHIIEGEWPASITAASSRSDRGCAG